MKHILFTLTLFSGLGSLYAQAPQGINYQAVARDNIGTPQPDQSVTINFKIRTDTPPNGSIVFEETQNKTTDNCGMFNAKIGQANAQAFSTINWASGSKFLEVTINGSISGTTEILSVPYALYAEKTNLQAGNSGISINGNTISNTGDNDNNAANELQALSINGNTISLSQSGGSVQIPSNTPEFYVFEERYDHGLVPTTGSGASPLGNTFNTRNINTQVFPASGGSGNVTLGGNGFLTFKPGTYIIDASAPAFYTSRHQIFLRRLDNTIDLVGTSEYARNNNDQFGIGSDQGRSFIKGVLIVPSGADRTVKIDHHIETSTYTAGGTDQIGGILFGVEHSQTGTVWNNIKEVYTTIMIQKIQ